MCFCHSEGPLRAFAERYLAPLTGGGGFNSLCDPMDGDEWLKQDVHLIGHYHRGVHVGEFTQDAVLDIERIRSRWNEFVLAGANHSLMALRSAAQPVLGHTAVSAQIARGRPCQREIVIIVSIRFWWPFLPSRVARWFRPEKVQT
jgi:hypothetical protein